MHITPDFTGLIKKSLLKKYGINNVVFGELVPEKDFSRCSLLMESQLGEYISGTLTIQEDILRPHRFNFNVTAGLPPSFLMDNPLVVAIEEVNKEVFLNFLRPLHLVYTWVNHSVGINILDGTLIWEGGAFSLLTLNMDLQFALNIELHPKAEDRQQRKVLMYLSCMRMNAGIELMYQHPFTLNTAKIKTDADTDVFKLQLLKDYLDAYQSITQKPLILSQEDLDTISYSQLFDYLKIQAMHDIR